MIKRVRGNSLTISVALTQTKITGGTTTSGVFVIGDDDTVRVRLVGRTSVTYVASTTVESTNVIVFTDNGTLPSGVYSMEILVTTGDLIKYRSYETNVLEIVEANSEADSNTSDTFSETSVKVDGRIITDKTVSVTVTGVTTSEVNSLIAEALTPYIKTAAVNTLLAGYVQKVTGKGLSTNDLTNELLAKINASQQAGVSLDQVNTLLAGYVQKQDGKGLSTNDLTDELLSRINSLSGSSGVTPSELTTILLNYITSTKAEELYQPKGSYLTAHQSLADYLKKSIADTLYQTKGNYLTSHQSLDAYLTKTLASQTYQPKGTYLTEHQSLEGYAKTADLNTTDWDDASDKAHEHTNKSVLDGITSTKVSSWDKALPFENTYVSNANSWLTNGYTKTGTSTSNLPSGKNWGVLFFIAENATNGTGVQMWFGLSGEVYVRSITSKSPSSSWSQLATLDNLSSYLTTDSASQTYQVKGNYLTEHQTLKTINGQSLVGDGNISITSDSTTSYDDTEVRTLIGGKMDKEEVVSMTASTASISPNKFYKWGEVSSLVVTLATPTDTTHTNHYHFRFQAGSATTLGVPASVIWQGGKEPPCTNGNVYEVSIVDGCASFMEFTPYDD